MTDEVKVATPVEDILKRSIALTPSVPVLKDNLPFVISVSVKATICALILASHCLLYHLMSPSKALAPELIFASNCRNLGLFNDVLSITTLPLKYPVVALKVELKLAAPALVK